jgi:transcription termination factor NusB
MNNRTLSRIVLIQILYEEAHQNTLASNQRIDELIQFNALNRLKPQKSMITTLLNIYHEHKDALGEIINTFLKNGHFHEWPLLLKCIVEMGACEALYQPDLPMPVIINEYIQMTNFFSFDDKISLVHGLLHQIGLTRIEGFSETSSQQHIS